ncbi:hypothetical protein [Bosea robiniae]|uniref:Uncharacterized protein n=1 Tax=Bosea robiniae TaxID=1036780 RepID=A0ABY0NEY5_9HYPH|nr:hypothetical protein [Bosea robiniae]SDF36755.1 hypothetical protein SAMN05421844_101443 [Bosea robiniae]
MNEKVEAMIGNRDGKFVERLIPNFVSALLAVAVALETQYLGFWSDSKAADVQTAAAITRLTNDLAETKRQFKEETMEIKRSAEIDRQKTNELSADVKVILAIMQWIERKVDAR